MFSRQRDLFKMAVQPVQQSGSLLMRRENDFTNVRKFGCISEFIEINHNRFFISIINHLALC